MLNLEKSMQSLVHTLIWPMRRTQCPSIDVFISRGHTCLNRNQQVTTGRSFARYCITLQIITNNFWQEKTTEDLKQVWQFLSFSCTAWLQSGLRQRRRELCTQTPRWKCSWAHNPSRHPPLSNFYRLLTFHTGWNLTLSNLSSESHSHHLMDLKWKY